MMIEAGGKYGDSYSGYRWNYNGTIDYVTYPADDDLPFNIDDLVPGIRE